MAGRFPESIALRLDPGTRRSEDGRSVLGGAPLRLLRLSDVGAQALDRLLAGSPGGRTAAEAAVARRLVDAGIAHPRPSGPVDASLSLVIPVRDHADDLRQLLDADPVAGAPTVVVDDGSADAAAVRRAVGERGVVRRSEASAGPGVARNTGWRSTGSELVVFLDADVLPEPGWLDPLLAHFEDPDVGMVAPRVRSRDLRGTLLERYERERSPLDLGPDEARVVPRGRVSYVPTAAVVCRRAMLDQLGGFDDSMRIGEDVDLVWRAAGAGWTVRYEPASVVTHRPRRSWSALLRQRATYGSAAATLDQRHPGQVAPVECNAWSLGSWALVALGGRLGLAAGTITAVGSSVALVPRLEGRLDHPARSAFVLAGGGTLRAGLWLARATWRAWLPFAIVGSFFSRRVRRVTALAAVAPALADHRSRRPDVGPVTWTALHALDDAAYCAGVWRGVFRRRSARCLAPRLSGIPGVTDRARGRVRVDRHGPGEKRDPEGSGS